MFDKLNNKIRLFFIKKQFDKAYYLNRYPDVKETDIDPWKHFKKYGFREGRYFNEKDERGGSKKRNLIERDNTKLFKIGDQELLELKTRAEKIKEKILSGDYTSIKILYISTTNRLEHPVLDPSVRYRCFHPCEALGRQGAYTAVVSTATFLMFPSYDYDIYIFHRPNNSLSKAIQQLRYMNKILIAEYDDLVFGPPETALQSSIYKNKVANKEDTLRIFTQNTEIMKEFSNFSVSTANLAEKVREQVPSANVNAVHNFIPESILQMSRMENLRNAPKDKKLIMYCSGTLSHNKDFKTVEPLLLEALERDPELKLYIFGVLTAGEELLKTSQIFFHPAVDYTNMFLHMRNSAFTIAPLENSVFNDCKSNVKFLESCIAGTTLIASPIEDMMRVKDAGGIVLPETRSDWSNILSNLDKIDINGNIEKNYNYLIKNCSEKTFLEEFTSVFAGMEA